MAAVISAMVATSVVWLDVGLVWLESRLLATTGSDEDVVGLSITNAGGFGFGLLVCACRWNRCRSVGRRVAEGGEGDDPSAIW